MKNKIIDALSSSFNALVVASPLVLSALPAIDDFFTQGTTEAINDNEDIRNQNHPAREIPILIETLDRTTQPIGHYEFCLVYADECQQYKGQAVKLLNNSDNLYILNQVNQGVNEAIIPATDVETYGEEEYWAHLDIPDVFTQAASQMKPKGDCEEYAIAKRRMLIMHGAPASALSIAVVRQPNGEGHAVLVVRTQNADYILDNLRNKILEWNQTEYSFIKMQSDYDAGQWVNIAPSSRNAELKNALK